jgi:hypothetical protein
MVEGKRPQGPPQPGKKKRMIKATPQRAIGNELASGMPKRKSRIGSYRWLDK